MYKICKRIFDFISAGLLFLVLLPLFVLICIWVKLDSNGPVFFRQKRVGIHKTYFNILKFRTMRTDTPSNMPTHLLSHPDSFITKSGKFLRKSSLDELPQLLNILSGKMSVVGPRPALWNQYDLIEERDKYGANDVPVGLTGWAQINGRDELPIPNKAALDGEYVNLKGFSFDIKVIFMTAANVFKSKGVIEGGTGTLKKKENESHHR